MQKARVEYNATIIHEAITSDQPENLLLLARAGADINVNWGSTPLSFAVKSMSWSMASTLLDLGADTSFRNKAGYTSADSFCRLLGRITPTKTNREPILNLFVAFERRGVQVDCVDEAARFRE